jgi:hypothetical protein
MRVVVVAEGDAVAFGLNWEGGSRRTWLGGAGAFVFGHSFLGGFVFGRYVFTLMDSCLGDTFSSLM